MNRKQKWIDGTFRWAAGIGRNMADCQLNCREACQNGMLFFEGSFSDRLINQQYCVIVCLE